MEYAYSNDYFIRTLELMRKEKHILKASFEMRNVTQLGHQNSQKCNLLFQGPNSGLHVLPTFYCNRNKKDNTLD